MKFKIFLADYGFFNEAQMACALGLRRTVNGRGWYGWVSKEDIDLLEKNGYRFKILF